MIYDSGGLAVNFKHYTPILKKRIIPKYQSYYFENWPPGLGDYPQKKNRFHQT
jgi:hypothetical protein